MKKLTTKEKTNHEKHDDTVTILKSRDGGCILPLPTRLMEDFRTRPGNTITITPKKTGGLICRFYRQTQRGWRQLLPQGKSRPVSYPHGFVSLKMNPEKRKRA
jgi:hypothetical protein